MLLPGRVRRALHGCLTLVWFGGLVTNWAFSPGFEFFTTWSFMLQTVFHACSLFRHCQDTFRELTVILLWPAFSVSFVVLCLVQFIWIQSDVGLEMPTAQTGALINTYMHVLPVVFNCILAPELIRVALYSKTWRLLSGAEGAAPAGTASASKYTWGLVAYVVVTPWLLPISYLIAKGGPNPIYGCHWSPGAWLGAAIAAFALSVASFVLLIPSEAEVVVETDRSTVLLSTRATLPQP
eukprot:GDKH01024659.1.p1 GENE.GDKH01024659.1~~GDKH01024659.1.p1  ORF type:complete len:238 (-),score=3.96 GDKH01024659.1:107-820(-)